MCPQRLPRLYFYFLWISLLSIYVWFVCNNYWLYDFWTQAALALEISKNPFSASNPFILDSEPGHFYTPYWPYSVLVSLLMKAFSLTPHYALSVFGFLNLAFLGFALHSFCKTLRKSYLFSALTIMLMLSCWGYDAWFMSGMFHMDVIFFSAAYPSCFAFALSLFTISYWEKSRRQQNLVSISLVALLSVLVILIHPLTFMFLSVMLFLAHLKDGKFNENYPIIFIIALSIAAAYFWPFFPLKHIFTSGLYSADPNAQSVYRNVLVRIFPCLALGIPIIAWRLLKNRRDQLTLGVLAFTFIYLTGYLTENWNLGRSIYYMVFLLQISIACFVSELFENEKSPLLSKVIVISIAFVFWTHLAATVIRTKNTYPVFFVDYESLLKTSKQIPSNSVVLSDVQTSLFLPSFGVKVVAVDYPPFIGEEFEQRREVLNLLKPSEFSEEKLVKSIQAYGIKYLVIDKAKILDEKDSPVSRFGRLISSTSRYDLYSF